MNEGKKYQFMSKQSDRNNRFIDNYKSPGIS